MSAVQRSEPVLSPFMAKLRARQHFIGKREQGHTIPQMVLERIVEKREALNQKADAVANALLQRNQQVADAVNPIIESMEKMKLDAAAKKQVKNLETAVTELRGIQGGLRGGLQKAREHQDLRRRENVQLQQELNDLRSTLKKAPLPPSSLSSQAIDAAYHVGTCLSKDLSGAPHGRPTEPRAPQQRR